MRSPPSAPTLGDLRSFLTLGLSLLAATRDARLAPALCRCGGARLGDDNILRVAVAMPEGTRSVADIESTGMIALTGARPTTYRTLQVKGRDARRVVWPELEEVVLAHRAAFVAEVVGIGLPRDLAPAMWSSRFVAVGFTPEEIFDQTPGPSAGRSLVA